MLLKTYTGTVIQIIGFIFANVSFEKKNFQGKLYIVDSDNHPLLGREWLNELNFKLVCTDVIFFSNESNLQNLLNDFKELFDERLGCYKYNTVSIKINQSVKPIFRKPFSIPFAFKEKVEKELIRLEKEDIISKIDNSNWGTPLTLVLKKNGDLRLCANYKITVNPFIEEVNYPIPKIEELFVALQGGQEFSKLDLSQAYNQLMLDNDSKLLLAWSTHKGIYAVNRLPFGIKPAGAIFQNEMDKTLLNCPGVIVFFDDILVTGTDRKDHLSNLKNVFEKLKAAGLKLKESKCEFLMDKINYLGHIIDRNGLKKDPDKIKALVNMPVPQNKRALKIFLGLANIYRKFVPYILTL